MSEPTAAQVKAALMATLGAAYEAADLPAGIPPIVANLDHLPEVITACPILCTVLDESPISRIGALERPRYRFLHRIAFDTSDPAGAERQLMAYAGLARPALDSAYQLGLFTLGRAKVDNEVTGYWTVANSLYRILDIYTDTLAKV